MSEVKQSFRPKSSSVQTKRWFVCYDGSDSAKHALNTTLFDLVNRNRPDIIAVCVVGEETYERSEEYISGMFDQEKRSGHTVNWELLCVPSGAESGTDAAKILCSEAKRYAADFMVCGCRGLSTLKKAFIGSASEYIVNHAHCPVVIARGEGDAHVSAPIDVTHVQ
eukprot:TRINITY_DN1052_c0_g1_i1.p1 TRINITY_DN1052_c0_g1~~TRINITY_DN1052_c0_g1_i1.p1  ORF type:complete len:182 (+),score=36.75 TRINITY_DN1052_c0_g1_i1:51-548(+)